MKKQVKLTETELFDVIEESVKSLVMEYGEKNPEVRSAMAKAAKRAIDNGNDETYHRAVKSITDAGGSKEALQDLNDKFEKESLNSQPANNITGESRRPVKVSESQLMAIIGESVRRILAEADPRSWDAVARRYDQTDPQKAAYARQRAAQQWNSKFSKPIDNDWNKNDVQMHDGNGYYVSGNQYSKSRGGNYATYDPYSDTTKEHDVDNNGRMMWDRPETWDKPEMKGVGGNIMSKQRGLDVAQQMAQGNGVYDKSKGGWQ